jgi:glycosyltransferase involved in cell wall biosynthesis
MNDICRQISTTDQKGISIVICCFNAQDRIGKTLEHIQHQVFSRHIRWEVIIIDNASTDNTAEVAAAVWDNHPVTDFQIYRENKAGLNHARNRGFKEAQYEIVSLVDDDNWLEPNWVEKVYTIFEQYESVGACAGQNIPVSDSELPDWFEQFKKSYATGQLHFNEGIVDRQMFGNLWGAGMSIRKEIIQNLERINFTFVTSDRKGKSLSCGGDTELCYAIRLLGYDLYYTNDLSLKHFIPSYRLHWDYVKNLNYEFGKMHAMTEPYFDLYHKKPKRVWMKNIQTAFILFCYYRLSVILQTSSKGRWKYIMKAIWWKGKADQLWKDKKAGYTKTYIQLEKMFKTSIRKIVSLKATA